MLLRRIIFIVVLLSNTFYVFSQTHSLSFGCSYGFTSPHHPDMWNYITGHARQFHLQYSTPRDTSLEKGGHTLKAIDFCFINPGNPDTMGYSFGLSPQFHFPLNKKYKSYFVLGCGLEYNTKTYTKENCAFNAIGSHFNALIIIGYKRTFHLLPALNLNTELLWTHFSNGATKAPNLGLNIPTLGLGLQYQFHSKKDNAKEKNVEDQSLPGSWQLIVSGSRKQVKYDGKVCSVFCLSGEKYFKPDNNSSFGAGVDLILDYSMNERITEFSDTIVPFTNNFKVAIKSLWTVPVGQLQIHLQLGTYIKNSNFDKEFILERLSLRYFIKDNLGLNIALRAHFAKADAIEFGVVYKVCKKTN